MTFILTLAKFESDFNKTHPSVIIAGHEINPATALYGAKHLYKEEFIKWCKENNIDTSIYEKEII